MGVSDEDVANVLSPVGRTSSAAALLQMLAQQVCEQRCILIGTEDGSGGHVVSAAFALIEVRICLDQAAALDLAVADQDV